MNLTDDMLQLKKVADGIYQSGNMNDWLADKNEKETYFVKRSQSENKGLFVYDIESAADLRKYLNEQWQVNGKEYMKEFIPLCMVATGKSKLHMNNKANEHEVSPYIYVF